MTARGCNDLRIQKEHAAELSFYTFRVSRWGKLILYPKPFVFFSKFLQLLSHLIYIYDVIIPARTLSLNALCFERYIHAASKFTTSDIWSAFWHFPEFRFNLSNCIYINKFVTSFIYYNFWSSYSIVIAYFCIILVIIGFRIYLFFRVSGRKYYFSFIHYYCLTFTLHYTVFHTFQNWQIWKSIVENETMGNHFA